LGKVSPTDNGLPDLELPLLALFVRRIGGRAAINGSEKIEGNSGLQPAERQTGFSL
jgi:hypothetical protein